MEFKEAMRIWKRMCKAQVNCERCPMTGYCSMGFKEHPEEVQAILAKWAAEHPEKTIADDFFEKYPRAKKNSGDFPIVCAAHCGYIDKCPDDYAALACERCWRRPLEEITKND